MNKLPFLMLIAPLFLSISCSSVSKKDCTKDMKSFGLAQGRSGSPKKYTDDLRDKCLSRNPTIDLEGYEKAFYQGWMEYCLPNKAFDMGKRADRYISFCPADREALFREKYLVGKHYAELKDVEDDMTDKLNDLKPKMNESSTDFDNYTKLKLELDKVKRDMQALEVEGLKSTSKLR